MRIVGRTLLALIMGMVALLAVVSPQAGYAEWGEEGEKDSFYLFIHALRYAQEKSLFNDDGHLASLTESLTEWFATEVINPNAPISAEQTRDREILLSKIEYHPPRSALTETLLYLRKYDLSGPAISEVLAELYIERIAELTGDTLEVVRELLTDSVALEMSDRAALVALYNATDGDNWEDNTNWLSDLPIHRWYGINAYNGRVLSLDLSDNELSGEIPPEVGSLSELRYLDLSNNDLHGQIPFQIGNLPNLRKVALWGNRFAGCVPGSLYDLWFSAIPAEYSDNPLPFLFNNLYKLDLPNCGRTNELMALYEATDGANWTDNTNWMSDRPIGEWHGVTTDADSNIIRLELDDNNLSGRIPPELGNLTSLTQLSMSGNRLGGDIPQELGNLSELGSLNLFGNRLSGEIPPELSKLSNLKSLSLGGNRIRGCLPDGLSNVPRIDLSALGVPFCGSDAGAPSPSLVLAAFSPSPTKMNLFWVNNLEAESVTIYRNGAPVATPSLDLFHYTDGGLNPNVRYEYRIKASLADGSAKAVESSATTLAYAPAMAGPMDVNESGLTLAMLENSNPAWTEYRVTLNDISKGREFISDWSASRCRTFEGLEAGEFYSFSAVSRNMDGVESELVGRASNHGEIAHGLVAQWKTGNDDPWAIGRINDAANLYGVTEAAREWLVSDIYVEGYRDRTAYGVYFGVVDIGYLSGPGTLMHEMMHGFWEHWTGFPQPCYLMNVYTFDRDVARFLLDFRDYDRSIQPNPLEYWRPFYNLFFVDSGYHSSSDINNIWQLLEQGEYHKLWDDIYHVVDTNIPTSVAGKMSLIPPMLRPYFQGFLADESNTTWREELYWYSSLPPQERRLWDTAYNYHGALNRSPQYAAPPSAPRTSIPAQKRELLRNADRKVLVDFINILEDLSCFGPDCEEFWLVDPGANSWLGYQSGWAGDVYQNLYRARLYLDEINSDTGIELAPANLAAVKSVLRTIVSDVSCGSASPSYLRRHINSATGVSDLQRNALLAMVDVLEREPGWYLRCGSDAALAEAWPAAPPRLHHHDHPAPAGWKK